MRCIPFDYPIFSRIVARSFVRMDSYQGYSLHLAAGNHPTCVDALAFLVDAWPESIQQNGNWYGYPLQSACSNFRDWYEQNFDNVQWLMNQWPEAVHVRDTDGRVPLHMVCDGKATLAMVRAV